MSAALVASISSLMTALEAVTTTTSASVSSRSTFSDWLPPPEI